MWDALLWSLTDDAEGREPIPGPCIVEWLEFERCGWDEVDALYLDHETQGGE